jgi:enoyl-[acyl-carrier protein] reductase III
MMRPSGTTAHPGEGMQLRNRIALVTGSGRGIGRAIALRLAADGADVLVNCFRNPDRARETAAEIEAAGRRACVVKANVGDPNGIERLIDAAVEFGGLDILVNNAASGYSRPIAEQRIKGWDWTLDINARAALFLGQKALPLMRERGGGHIVNVTSIGSQRVIPDYSVIGASKAALEAVTRYLAVEFAPHGVVANAVSPGLVATDALAHVAKDPEATRGVTQPPAGRSVTPEDVAGVVAFLCSPDAAMIRGQVIAVDGGYSVRI